MTRIDPISLNQADQFSAAAANMSPAALRSVQDRSTKLVNGVLSGRISMAEFQQSMELNINEAMKPGRFANGETAYRRQNGIRETEPLPPASTAETSDPYRINQLAYRGQTLGDGGSDLGRAGCLLAATTTASNRLNNRAVTLPQANTTVRNARQFSGSDMNFGGAAEAMDVTVLSRRRVTPDSSAMPEAIANMQNGRPPRQLIVGVDYKEGSQNGWGTDHFINVHSVSADGQRLHAVDSVGGRDLTFTRDGSGNWRAGHYTISEVSELASTRDVPPRVLLARKA
ncbi:MAG: hypothetical protein ACAI38_00175 [Myxococcota bacterium]